MCHDVILIAAVAAATRHKPSPAEGSSASKVGSSPGKQLHCPLTPNITKTQALAITTV
jgi:hypothetical protein